MTRHPQQRLASPSRTLSLLLHLAGLASFTASFRFLAQWETPMAHSYGGNYQFLTILGLATATATFAAGAAADVLGSRALFALKNRLAVVSTPLEVLVTVLYWGLCAIDRTLVIPPEFALDLLPDVGFHAAPGVFLAIDLLLFSPPWTVRAYSAVMTGLVFAFGYWFWVEYCFSKNGWCVFFFFCSLHASFTVFLIVLTLCETV
jgi:hypothetical protein